LTEETSREDLFLLAAKLAARTAHELNNTSAILSGHLYLLRASPDSHEESYEAMEKALAQIQRLSRGLARLGLLGEGEVGPVDWNEAARSASDALGAPVTLDLAGGLPRTVGREGDACAALKALLENALEASLPRGEIVLRTRSLPDGAGVLLAVEDSGKGISPEARERAFDPLFSTKGERGRGTGLVLAAAVAAVMGGSCQVEPRPEGGTRVTLRLPRDSP